MLLFCVIVIIYLDAAKKHHEYLVRQFKPVTEEERNCMAKNNRLVQRYALLDT